MMRTKPRKPLAATACVVCAWWTFAAASGRADDAEASGNRNGKLEIAIGGAEGADGEAAEPEKAKIVGLEMLPAGKTNLSVRLPVYEGSRQTMLFKADEMTPLDKDELEMKGVEIRIMGEGGGADTTITMASGRYVVSTGVLSSDERTVVSGADYTIVGDSLDFDTGKKTGVMRGRVKMTIHDFDKLAGDEKKAKVKDADSAEGAETETTTNDENQEIQNTPEN